MPLCGRSWASIPKDKYKQDPNALRRWVESVAKAANIRVRLHCNVLPYNGFWQA